jgi:putative membrane protein
MRSTERDHARRLAAGGVAGLAATLPMTVVMEVLNRSLPHKEPLPPRMVTVRVAEEAGVAHRLDERDRVAATAAAHFGFGAAMGALYGLAAARIPLRPALAGAAFGMAVYAANYAGTLPALGLLRPATQFPARRNALLIASHLVWGAAAGLIVERLLGDG